MARGRAAKSWMLLCVAVWSAAAGAETLLYNRDIRPILSENCFQCHGYDRNARKAELRLDEAASATAARAGGAAIVPGDPDASGIILRIFSDDPDEVMPPPGSGRGLSAAQRETLRRWVAEGAVYQPHWAYMPPVRAAVPQAADAAWPRNPIDHFVAAEHAKHGLEPAPDADPATLVRRLYLDVLGLPPTPEVIAEYAADPSEAHYARLVEEVLASPHYGERMAMDWLDVVRYADTNGYHGDEFRTVWPYRDYVISAFNRNVPFDRFTLQQIAGDLLENATIEDQIASGYNRLNQITAEGGAQAKEYLAKYAADRVRTLGTAWLGSTLGCAECHDHKFDPFSMRDFYSMEAFFADIQELGVYGAGSDWAPTLALPTAEQEARKGAAEARIREIRAALAVTTPELAEAQAAWEEATLAKIARLPEMWRVLRPVSVEARSGTQLAVLEDGSVLSGGPKPDRESFSVRLETDARQITALRLEALLHPEVAEGLSRGNGNFILTDIEVRAGERIAIGRASATHEQAGFPVAHAIDKDPKSGWAVEGHTIKQPQGAMFVFAAPIAGGPGTVLTVKLRFNSDVAQHVLACFRLAISTEGEPILDARGGLPEEVFAAFRVARVLRTVAEQATVDAYYRGIAPAYAPLREELAAKEAELAAIEAEVPKTLVTRSVTPRTIRILPRGNWMDDSGEEVVPATPSFLPALAVARARLTRLDLARWLVDERNPLTARVQMNRLWKRFFGTGLSKVLDDLGMQGEWPSHPELLDWLAVEFRESGWDLKHMVRLMVGSRTYRQRATATAETAAVDPYNRLLARQSSFRLPAETIRDHALAVSGLLTRQIGGRSVFPYQPEGYWDNCNTFRGPLIYATERDAQQYRRGLYTIWKRSFLHPSMLAFDAPAREECTADRVVSNTPLQALVLLNDPTYVEAARAFAGRILGCGASDDAVRAGWAFEQLLGRGPSARETEVVLGLLAKHRAAFAERPADVAALFSVGLAPVPSEADPVELAAWTSVARALLNLHETVTRS